MDSYQIPNLIKACQTLTWLAAEPGATSASEVARHLDMPRTSAFRILRTLCATGLLEEVDGKYRRGPGLLRLGLLALESAEINALATPILRDLADASDETAHLAVRAGDQIMILQVADSPHPIRVASRPGTLVEIHCSATGKAILAALAVDDVRMLLAGVRLERRTERTLTALRTLEAELEQVRHRGYAIDDEEYHDGVRCLAAVVRDGRGDAVAAIGVTATALRFTKRKIPAMARLVIQAADALSEAMGGPTSARSNPRAGTERTERDERHA